jgi:hypothetical protein
MPELPARNKGWPKVAAVVAVSIIVVGGGFLFVPFLFLQKRRPVAWVASAQTPTSRIAITPYTLAPHGRACLSSVTVTPNSRAARFQPHPVSESPAGGPPIELVISAPGYQTVGHLAGGYSGVSTVASGGRAGKASKAAERAESSEEREISERAKHGQPKEGGEEIQKGRPVLLIPRQSIFITPPRRPVIGTACFINVGSAPVLLDGTSEPRVATRSTVTIDGKPVPGTIGLTFFDERPTTRANHLGEIFAHASNLTDRLIPVWLVWIIVMLALIGIPSAVVAAFYRGLREDEASP